MKDEELTGEELAMARHLRSCSTCYTGVLKASKPIARLILNELNHDGFRTASSDAMLIAKISTILVSSSMAVEAVERSSQDASMHLVPGLYNFENVPEA